ncbi:MAG: hypothetical protein AB1791_20115 [Chloroflexota bacterium]
MLPLIRVLKQRGWAGPAQVLLEELRPLAFVAGQLLWVAQPALTLLWSRQTVGQVARLLEEPAALDDLLRQLDTDGQD